MKMLPKKKTTPKPARKDSDEEPVKPKKSKPKKKEESDEEEEPVKPKKSTKKKPKKVASDEEEEPVKSKKSTKKKKKSSDEDEPDSPKQKSKKKVGVKKWDHEEVIEWLTENKFKDFVAVFQEEQVNGSLLLKLTDDNLVEMGLAKVAGFKRLKLIDAIEKLKGE